MVLHCEINNSCLSSRGRGYSIFFQVGVCSPDFQSVWLVNWSLPLKGGIELKISKFGGLRAKIWAEIKVVGTKFLIFFSLRGVVNWLLLEMGFLWTTGCLNRTFVNYSLLKWALVNYRRGVKRRSSGPHIPIPPL